MIKRANINIMGAVQGVGFRPFVFRLAKSNNIRGYVINDSGGVFIDAEGNEEDLLDFIGKIHSDKPALSYISYFHYAFYDFKGYDCFEIRQSDSDSVPEVFVLPDFSVCEDCLREMFDPTDRRYLYPFINCTNCGPRFTIIESLPYDRENTVMKEFAMCPECHSEYIDPLNRRYHAQPTACPVCGPQMVFLDNRGNILAEKNDAIELFCDRILKGDILGLKGIGGFQLVTSADNLDSVRLLRLRKKRTVKPFAMMFPDLKSVKEVCSPNTIEEGLLHSPQAPIVILAKKDKNLYSQIAPNNPNIGIMLPYSPLHHLIMKKLNVPVVATSGNLAEEPMCIGNAEVLTRLEGIADGFLVHNRRIIRHADDSIVRVIGGRPVILRRARGYAPLPVFTGIDFAESLAGGSQLKNSIAFSKGKNVFVSQHIGDLETLETLFAHKKVIEDITGIYRFKPELYIKDLHPDYLSSKYMDSICPDAKAVQHHVAHIYSCRAENRIEGNALGVAWDGIGLGTDGTLWGGEFFLTDDYSCKRISSLKKFILPGGENAIREPRRSALGVLYNIFGNDLFFDKAGLINSYFTERELSIFSKMFLNKINCILTSSAGRLFDAVSCLLGLCTINEYEGYAAMLLEFACASDINDTYSFSVEQNEIMTINWTDTINDILSDKSKNVDIPVIAAKFHNTLANMILSVSKIAGAEKVVLSGGCFQNKYLTERTMNILGENGFNVYYHQAVPPNDGGISLGQIAAGKIEFLT